MYDTPLISHSREEYQHRVYDGTYSPWREIGKGLLISCGVACGKGLRVMGRLLLTLYGE